MELNLPSFNPSLNKTEKGLLIECLVRNKYVQLTPEEWVRQHFINFLEIEKGVSKTRMAVEKLVIYNGLKKRADIVVFNSKGQTSLVVELKAPMVALSQATLLQISSYASQLKVEQLCVSNGLEHYCFKWNKDAYEEVNLKALKLSD